LSSAQDGAVLVHRNRNGDRAICFARHMVIIYRVSFPISALALGTNQRPALWYQCFRAVLSTCTPGVVAESARDDCLALRCSNWVTLREFLH
jgi:hypothetical protein